MSFLRLLLIILLAIIVIRFLRRLVIGLASALRGGSPQNTSRSSPPQRYRDVKDAEFEDLEDKTKQ